MPCIPALGTSHTSTPITVTHGAAGCGSQALPRHFPGMLMCTGAKLPPLFFSCPDLWEDYEAIAHITGLCSPCLAPAGFPSRAMPGLDVCDTLAWLTLN